MGQSHPISPSSTPEQQPPMQGVTRVTDTGQRSDTKSLIVYPDCKRAMRLFGGEPKRLSARPLHLRVHRVGRLEVGAVRVTE
jgi:hypothetical protein